MGIPFGMPLGAPFGMPFGIPLGIPPAMPGMPFGITGISNFRKSAGGANKAASCDPYVTFCATNSF